MFLALPRFDFKVIITGSGKNFVDVLPDFLRCGGGAITLSPPARWVGHIYERFHCVAPFRWWAGDYPARWWFYKEVAPRGSGGA